jgi:3-hydroxyisobutyrate dehydrogenase
VNQVIIAGVYLAVAEGLVLTMKAGLDPEAVVSALGGGVAGSWILQNRSARMIANEYPLGFRTSLHLKDLGIALGMGRELGVTMPLAGLAAQLEAGLLARGYGDEDMSNLARAIRSLSALDG